MFKFILRLRIMPVAIFIAVLIVSVKIGDLADLLSGKSAIEVTKVQAQQPPAPNGGPTPLQAPPAAQAQAQGQAQDQAKDRAEAQPQGQSQGQPAPAPAAPQRTADDVVPAAPADASDPANDPTLFTQNEIDLLQSLAERREAIEKQSEEMTVRQGLLQAAEQRIDKKISELKTLQTAIDALIAKHDEQEEARVQSLVKIYEGMKPKDAGRIFETLDIDTLLLVAERMKERKLAPIMAAIDPEKAKELTVKIATARKLPTGGAGS
jgi:flagellar motility protein MotE (MotC chaperone)